MQFRLKHEDELLPRRVEGLPEARWVLVDYLDCILHVFVAETRELLPARAALGRGAADRSRTAGGAAGEGDGEG